MRTHARTRTGTSTRAWVWVWFGVKSTPKPFLKSFHSFPRARISATAVFVSSGIWRRAHSSVLKQKLFSVQGFCKLPAIMKSLNQFIVSVCNIVFSVSISHCSHFFPWFLSKTLELSVASSTSFETNTQEDSQPLFLEDLMPKEVFQTLLDDANPRFLFKVTFQAEPIPTPKQNASHQPKGNSLTKQPHQPKR